MIKIACKFCLFQHKSRISVIMMLFMMSSCKNQLENDVITTDIKSAVIHLLNYHSIRQTQSFSFLDKINRASFAVRGPSSFDLCSALLATEQWGFFSVPRLLWHGTSVYNCHLREPVSLTPIVEHLAVELSLPVLTT